MRTVTNWSDERAHKGPVFLGETSDDREALLLLVLQCPV